MRGLGKFVLGNIAVGAAGLEEKCAGLFEIVVWDTQVPFLFEMVVS